MEKSKLAFKILGASFYIGVSIFLGVAGGLWVDHKLNTQPIFILIGLILGLVVAFWGFYRMIIPIIKDATDPKHNRKGDSK
jgi:ATP synthase protein I